VRGVRGGRGRVKSSVAPAEQRPGVQLKGVSERCGARPKWRSGGGGEAGGRCSGVAELERSEGRSDRAAPGGADWEGGRIANSLKTPLLFDVPRFPLEPL
jgi:hypothetical protein